MSKLERKLNEGDISQAVSEAAAGKSSGMNGIISELWKRLSTLYDEAQKSQDDDNDGKKRGNIIKVLTLT
jgi:hypothetical protein